MEKKSTHKKLVLSVRALPLALQKIVRKASIISGSIGLILYVLFVFSLGSLAFDDLFPLIIFFGVFVCAPVALARFWVLSKFGYALPFHLISKYAKNPAFYSDFNHTNTSFHSHDSSSHSYSNSYHSSINPSSGLPMCGSSGIDTSGNPYGSRSW